MEKIRVFNVNQPGKSGFVQKDKYEETKRVMKELMPDQSPGLTQDELAELVRENVSGSVFEDRSKSGWWMKTVQLDLEARGVVIRENSKPARWYYDRSRSETVPEAAEARSVHKKEAYGLPDELRNRLIGNDLMDSYLERPFYQRNDYIGWILSAKREETRNKRTDQMLEELRDGGRYMNMPYKTGGTPS